MIKRHEKRLKFLLSYEWYKFPPLQNTLKIPLWAYYYYGSQTNYVFKILKVLSPSYGKARHRS
jgi:hypothetical protein